MSTRPTPAPAAPTPDRTNCALSHLDYSWRDVDRDDLEVYLALDDKATLREYLQGVADVEYERGERWPN